MYTHRRTLHPALVAIALAGAVPGGVTAAGLSVPASSVRRPVAPIVHSAAEPEGAAGRTQRPDGCLPRLRLRTIGVCGDS
jgi:hypothetical protein